MTQKIYFNQSCKYPFDLDKVLYAGQDFRWQPWRDDWHSGVLAGNLIHIRQVGDVLEYKSHLNSDLDDLLRSYFRLDDPIDEIYDDISCRDAKVNKLAKEYPWLRVLRQPDPWECMVAYICSPRSNVPSIRGMVEAITWTLGCPIELDGDVRFIFPKWDTVFSATVEPLEDLRLGLNRHSRIFAAAERIHNRQLDLYLLSQPEFSYAEAIKQLEKCAGIKDKISNCIGLFALSKMEAFPVDSRVWEAIKDHFPGEKRPYNDRVVVKWAQDRFGEHAGYANQFLYLG